MPLLDVVKLYRASGDPGVENDRFAGELLLSDDSVKLVNEAKNSGGFGRFISVELDGDDFDIDDDELVLGATLSFEYRISSNSAEKFYPDAASFLSKCSLVKQGVLPKSFYLVKENEYFSAELDDVSPLIKALQNLCLLIKCFSELAHYHDAKNLDGDNKLVFLSNDGGTAAPIVIEVEPTEVMLKADLQDLSVLTSLLEKEVKLSAHYKEKLNVFSSTLSEFVKDTDTPANAFNKIVNSWGSFVELYHNNLATYLSGFAFHKAKKEVAEAEIKLAEQLANVTSDITGKLFSIPLSLAAVVTIVVRQGSFWGDVVLVSSLILVAVIVAGIVDNQKSKLNVVLQSKDLLAKSFEGKKSEYPEDLNQAIVDMNSSLNKNAIRAKRWLGAFYYLSLLPLIVGIIVLFFKHCYSA